MAVLPLDRLGGRLSAEHACLLVVYLTLGDPLADVVELATAAVDAGADVVELGVPTPGAAPRGADVALSYARARHCPPERSWELARELRARLPRTPLLALLYPHTVADIGADRLLDALALSDVDGAVLTDPNALPPARVADAGLSAIPLITPGADSARRRALEDGARHCTYQALADRTGARLDPARAARFAAEAAATATKPFLAGFGIRGAADIRAVAPHAVGVVIGSALLRGLAATDPTAQVEWTRAAVRRWKAATALTGAH